MPFVAYDVKTGIVWGAGSSPIISTQDARKYLKSYYVKDRPGFPMGGVSLGTFEVDTVDMGAIDGATAIVYREKFFDLSKMVSRAAHFSYDDIPQELQPALTKVGTVYRLPTGALVIKES